MRRLTALVCAEERLRVAEYLRDVHPFAQGAEGHSARRERGAELKVRSHFSAIAIAHVERMPPQSGVLAVKLIERQLRRQDRVGDIEQLPVARVDRVLRRVPQIGAGQRREDREAGVVGAGGVDPLLEFFKVRTLP